MPRLCSSLLLSLLPASASSAVTMAWTLIGNAGNACDPQGPRVLGAVGYEYYIGTYEVTNAHYTEFLTVAVTDTNALYNTTIWDRRESRRYHAQRGWQGATATAYHWARPRRGASQHTDWPRCVDPRLRRLDDG